MYHEPDYRDGQNWAAYPGKGSPALSVPDFLKNKNASPLKADVFFIHPTTYLCQDHGHCTLMIERNRENSLRAGLNQDPWNADLRDEKLNRFTDVGPIFHQASIFNGDCRIFAPRYRQAHIKAFFLQDKPEAVESLDLAYRDVASAFSYYLNEFYDGRPLLIAGHSQGSVHGVRLLKEFVEKTDLKEKLVAAYLPGIQIKKHTFEQLPLLNHPESIGGFLSWRCFQRGAIPEELLAEQGDSQCINPLVWTDTSNQIDCEEAPGLLDFNHRMSGPLSVTIEPKTKVLLVDLPPDAPMKKFQNLHIYDYRLFWTAIRKNVKLRIDRFMNETMKR